MKKWITYAAVAVAVLVVYNWFKNRSTGPSASDTASIESEMARAGM